MKHKVLIVGSGGREHALAWKLLQSPHVETVYVAPGNAGTAAIARNVAIEPTDLKKLVALVVDQDIDLTVVGPEAPLVDGLVDRLLSRGRRVVGPTAAAARIEASKAFAKQLMRDVGVPTANYQVFDGPEAALSHLAHAGYPAVIKADGLAAGKGVVICSSREEARDAIRAIMVDAKFGRAGRRVVIEEALSGPEISLIALVDGLNVVPLPVAQDHKRLGDGDTGPNTGGMGASSPVMEIDFTERARLSRELLEPVVRELHARGTPYRGVLFAGLMLTECGPKVLEFNCRFGDPEAQVIVPLIEDDLYPWLEAVAIGEISGSIVERSHAAVGVVLAAAGYPEAARLGERIEGLTDVPKGVLMFHAGTAVDARGNVRVAGGRVMTVVGVGASADEAATRAYSTPVHFAGMQRRFDIGWRARKTRMLLAETPKPAAVSLEQVTKLDQVTHGPWVSLAAPESRTASSAENRQAPHSSGGRIGVLASGRGTNLQALLAARESRRLPADVALVVSHTEGAGALDLGRGAGASVFTLPLADRSDPAARLQLEVELLRLIRNHRVDLVVLAGWMLILSAEFLDRCPVPLINVHPALLPLPEADPLAKVLGTKIPVLTGAHAVRDALRLRLPFTGVSIHYVTPEVDAGPVLRREVIPIVEDDNEDTLYRRIKAVEHRLLPEAAQEVLTATAVGGVYA